MRAFRNIVRSIGAGVLVCALMSGLAVGADAPNGDRDVLRSISRAISQLAADVRPAVVSIYTARTVKMGGHSGAPAPSGNAHPPCPHRHERQRSFRRRGLGSGFIVDAKKGYVVTNNHVVAGADDIQIRLSDKRTFKGKLIGSDPKTDIAIVQIEAKNLKALKMGDSEKLYVGDFVVAVGSPFGLRETVSLGIVSAKGRSNLGIEDYEDFIQTDAAINVGNSGGPLVNIDGEVVGINTAILSRTGGSVGVGFAIPMSMAKGIIDQLIDSGKVTRGWLGVMIQGLTPEVAERFGVSDTMGALVTRVLEGTPAAKAGLKAGDIVLKYDGRGVAGVAKFRASVAATKPGSSVKVLVLRNGKRKTLTVKIEKLAGSGVAASGGGGPKELGLSVQDLTPELSKSLGVKAKGGVAVGGVAEGSPAADKGITKGDVIIELNRRRVKNAADFEAVLARANLRKGVLLLIVNRKGSRVVVLKNAAKK